MTKHKATNDGDEQNAERDLDPLSHVVNMGQEQAKFEHTCASTNEVLTVTIAVNTCFRAAMSERENLGASVSREGPVVKGLAPLALAGVAASGSRLFHLTCCSWTLRG